jgi:hypothetical protein
MDAIQAAKDQSLFRGVNERLLEMNVGSTRYRATRSSCASALARTA